MKEQEEEAKKQGHAGSGGEWFKFTEGDNRFRILAEPETIYEDFALGICYTDCGFEGSPKAMTYVLDGKDGKIKLAKLPYGVATTVAAYESDDDYAFAGFPMDYDIKVHAKNAGTKEVKYTVTPSPRREIVSSETVEELKKKKAIADIVQKMKLNNEGKHRADGSYAARQEYKKEAAEKIAAARAETAENPVEYPDGPEPESIPF